MYVSRNVRVCKEFYLCNDVTYCVQQFLVKETPHLLGTPESISRVASNSSDVAKLEDFRSAESTVCDLDLGRTDRF